MDIEAAVREDRLDIGVFGPRCRTSEGEAKALIRDIIEILDTLR